MFLSQFAKRGVTAGPDRGEILAALRRHTTPDATPGPTEWSIEIVREKAFRSGRSRRIFRAVNSATGQQLAVKADSNRRANRREFEALVRLHRNAPGCVTPRFIAEDASFLVMDWMAAPQLSDLLPGSDRDAVLSAAGEWLAQLHRATAGRRSRGPVLRHLRLPIGWGKTEEHRIVARLGSRIRAMSFRDAPMAMLHGDFHAENLFYKDGRVLAFDRGTDADGLTFIDIAKFMVDIAARRDRDAKRGQSWDGDHASDRRAFFEGYGEIARKDSALYLLIEDLVFFKKWRSHLRRDDLLPPVAERMRQLLDPGHGIDGATGATPSLSIAEAAPRP